jgi:hypothetical protein
MQSLAVTDVLFEEQQEIVGKALEDRVTLLGSQPFASG